MRKAFKPWPFGTLDAYRATHREAAVVRPGAQLGGVIAVDRPRLTKVCRTMK